MVLVEVVLDQKMTVFLTPLTFIVRTWTLDHSKEVPLAALSGDHVRLHVTVLVGLETGLESLFVQALARLDLKSLHCRHDWT